MTKLFTLSLIVAGIAAFGPPLAKGAELKDFAGAWKTTAPKSLTNKTQDMELTVKYDEKGRGSPRFKTSDGDVVFFAGAVTADIFQEDGRDKVVLLREWDVTLSKDKKTMTWKEVKGEKKLEFKKQ